MENIISDESENLDYNLKCINTITAPSQYLIYRMTFFDNNQKFITCSANGEIALWDLTNHKILRRYSHGPIGRGRDVLISSTGHLVSVIGHQIQIWHVWTGTLLCTLTSSGHFEIRKVVEIVQPQSTQDLVLLSGDHFGKPMIHQINLSDFHSQSCLMTMPSSIGIFDLCLLDGNKVAVVANRQIRIHRLEKDPTWTLVHEKTLSGHNAAVIELKYLKNEMQLLSASDDHTCRLWNLNSGQCIKVYYGHRGDVHTILRLDENVFVSGSEACELYLWNKSKGDCLKKLEFPTDHLSDGVYDLKPWTGNYFFCLGGHYRIRVIEYSKTQSIAIDKEPKNNYFTSTMQ